METTYHIPNGDLDVWHYSPLRYRLTVRAFSQRNNILAVYALAYCYANHPTTRQAAERQEAV